MSDWLPLRRRPAPVPWVSKRDCLLSQLCVPHSTAGVPETPPTCPSPSPASVFPGGDAVAAICSNVQKGHVSNPCGSKAADELRQWRAMSEKWCVSITSCCAAESEILLSCGGSRHAEAHLRQAFFGASSTLRRHWYGWDLWVNFSRCNSWSAGAPHLHQFLDFLWLVKQANEEERGSILDRSLAGIVDAVAFAGRRAQIPALVSLMKGPAVQGYVADKAPSEKKEAPALPACALWRMEYALITDELSFADSLLVGYFLLCTWAGLRFGDGLRCRPSSLHCRGLVLRGVCWQTKTTGTSNGHKAMPWACLACGAIGSTSQWGWAHKYLQHLHNWLNSLPAEVASSVDFLLPGISPEGLPLHEPGELAPATLRFRRLLVAWNVCSAEDALSYTSHSCKTTLLSFAKQLDLNKSWSASQGHHRQPVAQGTAVPLYSRDDVIDALRLQCQIVCHLGRGWRPCMVQRRGAQPPLAEPFPFSVAGCLPSDISALETIVLNPALPASVLFPALGLCDSSDAHEGRKGRKRKEMDPSAAELNHNDEAHSEKDRLRSLKFSAFLERKSRSRARS